MSLINVLCVLLVLAVTIMMLDADAGLPPCNGDVACERARTEAFKSCCKNSVPGFPYDDDFWKFCDYSQLWDWFMYDGVDGATTQIELFNGSFDKPDLMRAYFHCYSAERDVTPCCNEANSLGYPITSNCAFWCNGSAWSSFDWTPCSSTNVDFHSLTFITICHWDA